MTTGPPPAEPVRCSVCGRKLRTKASRDRGRGARCDEKVSPNPGRDHSRIRLPRRPPARGAGEPDPHVPSLLDELPGGVT